MIHAYAYHPRQISSEKLYIISISFLSVVFLKIASSDFHKTALLSRRNLPEVSLRTLPEISRRILPENAQFCVVFSAKSLFPYLVSFLLLFWTLGHL